MEETATSYSRARIESLATATPDSGRASRPSTEASKPSAIPPPSSVAMGGTHRASKQNPKTVRATEGGHGVAAAASGGFQGLAASIDVKGGRLSPTEEEEERAREKQIAWGRRRQEREIGGRRRWDGSLNWRRRKRLGSIRVHPLHSHPVALCIK